MKITRMRTVLAGAVALAMSCVAFAGEAHERPTVGTSPGLEMLKSLAGTWIKLDEAGKPTDEVVSVYTVTAAGSVVQEVMFPGTEHEMVTMYHQDGANLVLTHYCAQGNQPHLKAVSAAERGELVFECQGGTNMASENDPHMHAMRIMFLGDDRLKSHWTQFQGGKEGHSATFDVARQK